MNKNVMDHTAAGTGVTLAAGDSAYREASAWYWGVKERESYSVLM